MAGQTADCFAALAMTGPSYRKVLRSIAEKYGTPCYVYSSPKLEAQCTALRHALPDAELRFAVKANSTAGILRRIFQYGFGADVVSGGELARAMRAGATADKIVFSGAGKTDSEIEEGVRLGVLFNAESPDELSRIHAAAHRQASTARVLLRVNPNIDARTNPYIATGLYATKFGIAEDQLEQAAEQALSLPHLEWVGLGCHLGSQITDLSVFENGGRRMAELAKTWKKRHPGLRILNLGGGLAVRYRDETPPKLADYARTVAGAAQAAGLQLLLEPGRWVVAEAGALLTRVITVKTTPEKAFAVVDAAMNDLIRPSLYEAYHPVDAVDPRPGKNVLYDVVGPVCETGDFLALDRSLPPLKAGDLLLVGVCGAYGATMASNYNSRPRAAEVWVDANGTPSLLRERETIDDLCSKDVGIS